MSILIRGMEMPKSCWRCQLLAGHRDDGICTAANRWLDDDDYFGWYQYPEGDIDTSKPINCPLVEVPTPHGRLIDADALLESIKEAKKKQPEISDIYDEDYFAVAEWVAYAPTIIESEETNEN